MVELQNLDCNCNNCIFMERDLEKFKKSQEAHKEWQLNIFNTKKENLIRKGNKWKDENNPKRDITKGNNLIREANKMKFQFNKKEAVINYGHCKLKNKDVSFIPNTLQLDTQECFKNRKEI